MLSITQWFETIIDSKLKTQLINNYKSDCKNSDKFREDPTSLAHALDIAFDWDNTTQGREYYKKIYGKIIRQEISVIKTEDDDFNT